MNAEQQILSRITVDPRRMVGKPTIRGLRITVEQLLKSLAKGISENELLLDYPDLQREDFQAIYTYAANLVESEKVLPLEFSA